MLKKYLPYIFLTIIVLIFSVALFSNLQYPREICNDEFYYAPAGQTIWQTPNEPNLEHHPPLAKYLIGLGIKIIGDYSIGWRLIPALFGIIGIIIVYFLTKSVLSLSSQPSTRNSKLINYFSLLAPFLLACDFLYFVMARQAMLDIFVTVFLLITSLFLWKYIQTNKKSFLILLGISFGLALSSKWTTILFVPLFLFLILQSNNTGKMRPKPAKKVFLEFLMVGFLAITVYISTYIPYLLKNNIGDFVNLQKNILVRMLYTKDSSGNGTSPFNTIFWPFFPSNTLSCYFDYEDNISPHSLSIISNPLIIWLFWPVLIYSFYQAFKKKEIQRFFVSAIIICLYVPWIAMEREKYFYYMTPVIPFLCILISQAIVDFVISKDKDSLNKLTPQKKISLPNKDLLDKIIIALFNLKNRLNNSKGLKLISQKTQSIITNKRLLFLLFTFYFLLLIVLFILYYSLLNGLPVSNSYRDLITFFWPFLF